MRRGHFQALEPVCPVCREGEATWSLALGSVVREEGDHVVEGTLLCTNSGCRREYPIVNGVPIVVAAIREYVNAHWHEIQARSDLSGDMEGLLGDCVGPDSSFDVTRRQLSSYCLGHYGSTRQTKGGATVGRSGSPVGEEEGLGEGEGHSSGEDPPAGTFLSLWREAVDLLGEAPRGRWIDLGCSVGRGSFELAQLTDELVLGVDLNFAMLRTAANALRHGTMSYSRRRVGLVYEKEEVETAFEGKERVDFWACDACALPFTGDTFSGAQALNLLDSVTAPLDCLRSTAEVLAPGGKAIFATPYDWSPQATPLESWIGGHSQRGEDAGDGATILRRLLAPGEKSANLGGLECIAERDHVPWRVELHDRSAVEYQVHLLVAAAARRK